MRSCHVSGVNGAAVVCSASVERMYNVSCDSNRAFSSDSFSAMIAQQLEKTVSNFCVSACATHKTQVVTIVFATHTKGQHQTKEKSTTQTEKHEGTIHNPPEFIYKSWIEIRTQDPVMQR